MSETPWGLPAPFFIEFAVSPDEIDGLGHVNNASYLQWCERVGWAHAESLGLGLERWQELDRAMATHRADLSYKTAAMPGDVILGATWIIKSDHRLVVNRRFEMRRKRDTALLFHAEVAYVCIAISSGKPKRLPPEFDQGFSVKPEVAEFIRS